MQNDGRRLPRQRLRHSDASGGPRGGDRGARSVRRPAQPPRTGPRGPPLPGCVDRAVVAAAIGAQPDEIVFTSGGTESVALGDLGRRARGARAGLPHRRERRRASRPSAACATFLRATASRSITIPVDGFGRVDLDRYAARDPPSRHAARERPARQPRARHDAAGRARPRAWPARRRSGSTSMRARPWGVSPSTWRRSAWTCSRCRDTSSEGRPGWERSTCAAGSASRPTRAATTASASAARAWRTRPGSRAWRRRSRRHSRRWATPRRPNGG